MKIRQCFLKLQLKMTGMFFIETHCINFVPGVTIVSPVLSYFFYHNDGVLLHNEFYWFTLIPGHSVVLGIYILFIFPQWWLVTPYQDFLLRRLHILSVSFSYVYYRTSTSSTTHSFEVGGASERFIWPFGYQCHNDGWSLHTRILSCGGLHSFKFIRT